MIRIKKRNSPLDSDDVNANGRRIADVFNHSDEIFAKTEPSTHRLTAKETKFRYRSAQIRELKETFQLKVY